VLVAKSKPPIAPKKPKKPSPKGRNGKFLVPQADLANTIMVGIGQAVAAPQFVQPTSGFFATPGADLRVLVSTLRPDLRYIITVTDVTDPQNPGAPQQINIPAPIGSGSSMLFAADVPGAWLVLGHKYQIRVFVDPADGLTPPHHDAAVDITCIQPPGLLVVTPGVPGGGGQN
jgi:hypothetical protein